MLAAQSARFQERAVIGARVGVALEWRLQENMRLVLPNVLFSDLRGNGQVTNGVEGIYRCGETLFF